MSEKLNLFEKRVEASQENLLPRRDEIKRMIEALLFSTHESIPLDKFKEIIDNSYPIRTQELKDLISELGTEYRKARRAFQIDEIAGGYLLRVVKEMQPIVEILHTNRRGEKLSKAALEVLAIIAYKQPITRLEIEKLRGVDSSGTLSSLLERELIEIVGKLEAPGRPSQYGVTKRFLRHFGLKDLAALDDNKQQLQEPLS